ncbi:hypothetical protein LSTR_LSTR001690 [Laodelphax striatellus]|uniref:Uncharacterized protein n=1 Tax=Laodelphax striatellus TaxID=195883 RepID=A0A482XDB7_LAOST|nr:hypothetical protein LSTR_LSTR001690 [Laodelphax striatellus]
MRLIAVVSVGFRSWPEDGVEWWQRYQKSRKTKVGVGDLMTVPQRKSRSQKSAPDYRLELAVEMKQPEKRSGPGKYGSINCPVDFRDKRPRQATNRHDYSPCNSIKVIPQPDIESGIKQLMEPMLVDGDSVSARDECLCRLSQSRCGTLP